MRRSRQIGISWIIAFSIAFQTSVPKTVTAAPGELPDATPPIVMPTTRVDVAPPASSQGLLQSLFGDLAPPSVFIHSDPVNSALWMIGNASKFYFGLKALGATWDVATVGVPAAIRAYRLKKRIKLGEGVVKEIEKMKPEISKQGALLRASARATTNLLQLSPTDSPYALGLQDLRREELDAFLSSDSILAELRNKGRRWLEEFRQLRAENPDYLEAHMQRVPEGIRAAEQIKRMRPEKFAFLLDHPEFKTEGLKYPSTRRWITEYRNRRARELAYAETVTGLFRSAAAGTTYLLKSVNETSKGVLMTPGVRQASYPYHVRAHFDRPGVIETSINGGGPMMTNEEVPLGEYADHFAARCNDSFAKLGDKAAESQAIALKKAATPVVLATLSGLGAVGYRYASSQFRQNYKITPEEVQYKRKEDEKKVEQQQALRVQEFDFVADSLRSARLGDKIVPKDARLVAIYDILRGEFRRALNQRNTATKVNLQRYVRERLHGADNSQTEHFEDRLEQFLSDEEWANGIIDSAIARAAGNENRSFAVESIEGMILKDSEDDSVKLRFLMKAFNYTAEYLWPQLKLDVDNSYFTHMTDASIKRIHTMIDEQKLQEKRSAEDRKKATPDSKVSQSVESPGKISALSPSASMRPAGLIQISSNEPTATNSELLNAVRKTNSIVDDNKR